ncbi:hypothetical protein ACG2K1_11935 [Neisseria sp. 23W00296]|uniref:hypothetical protein n=1 Tax=unclassified Neisseria TaxID=2623750 RepID=UPI003756F4E6
MPETAFFHTGKCGKQIPAAENGGRFRYRCGKKRVRTDALTATRPNALRPSENSEWEFSDGLK